MDILLQIVDDIIAILEGIPFKTVMFESYTNECVLREVLEKLTENIGFIDNAPIYIPYIPLEQANEAIRHAQEIITKLSGG
jgi:hypothetical protein